MIDTQISMQLTRELCESMYGSPISDRTWRKWKEVIGVGKYDREVSKADSKFLLALAYLKRQDPYGRFTYNDAFRTMRRPDFTLALAATMSFVATRTIPGRELPEFLHFQAGRKPPYSTLYFWGKRYPGLKFSKDRMYSPAELKRWIKIASKYA